MTGPPARFSVTQGLKTAALAVDPRAMKAYAWMSEDAISIGIIHPHAGGFVKSPLPPPDFFTPGRDRIARGVRIATDIGPTP